MLDGWVEEGRKEEHHGVGQASDVESRAARGETTKTRERGKTRDQRSRKEETGGQSMLLEERGEGEKAERRAGSGRAARCACAVSADSPAALAPTRAICHPFVFAHSESADACPIGGIHLGLDSRSRPKDERARDRLRSVARLHYTCSLIVPDQT